MRYFVVSNQPEAALRLLEQTVFRVPVLDPSGQEKYLRLPPATVCNKVLDAAAQVWAGCRAPRALRTGAARRTAIRLHWRPRPARPRPRAAALPLPSRGARAFAARTRPSER